MKRKRLVTGGFAAVCLAIGLGIVWSTFASSGPDANPDRPAAASDQLQPSSLAEPTPAQPSPLDRLPDAGRLLAAHRLPEVVEVADIDHLLDPPPRCEQGVPFDAEPDLATAPTFLPRSDVPQTSPPEAGGRPADPCGLRTIPDRIPLAQD